MVSGGMSCIKYLLFIFNLVFSITGIAILVIGAVILDFYSNYTDFIHGQFFIGPALLIIVGVVIFIVAFFGCCGAIKENHCMIMTFAAMLLIVFGMEIAGGIAGYVLHDDIDEMLENSVNKTMTQYADNKEISKTWDIMQHDLKCCGSDSPADWEAIFHNKTLPTTCCINQQDCTQDDEFHYMKGCLKELGEQIKNYAVLLGGVGIGVGCVQLIGVIFACCLAKSIRKEYETV